MYISAADVGRTSPNQSSGENKQGKAGVGQGYVCVEGLDAYLSTIEKNPPICRSTLEATTHSTINHDLHITPLPDVGCAKGRKTPKTSNTPAQERPSTLHTEPCPSISPSLSLSLRN